MRVVVLTTRRGKRPDPDTVYHQLQDAMSKDAFGIEDNTCEDFAMVRERCDKGERPLIYVEAVYERVET